MIDLIEDLKHRARLLHKAAAAGDPEASRRLGALPELRGLEPPELIARVRRHHCLSALGLALGFRGWPHARVVLAGEATPGDDLGELMTFPNGGAISNVWSASYDEARAIRADHGGFLLAYRRQFLITEAPYVEALGLSPTDPDWDRIGRDWAAPSDRGAWARLTASAIEARLSA